MQSAFGQGRRYVALAIAVACAVLAWYDCAFALNPAFDISQYAHTAWRIREGFTSGIITAIAQAPDGYLWLGTESGLFRFDGVRAVAWQPPRDQRLPSNIVVSLLIGRDGTLWIGTDKGLATWKDRKFTRYEELEGSHIGKLVEDRDGSIWMLKFVDAWTLCRLQKGRIYCYGYDGGPGSDAVDVYEDRRGTLWVRTRTGLWQWGPGAPKFYPLPTLENWIQDLADADDGALLVSTAGGISRFVDGELVTAYPFPPSMPPVQARKLLRDRDGGLWIASFGGIVHVHQGITDVFAQALGLSGDFVVALFEDREGDIWVATTEGLDRFREFAVVPYSVNQGLSVGAVSVLSSADGSVWLGTSEGLNRWTNGQVSVYRGRSTRTGRPRASREAHEITVHGIPAGSVQSIFQDSRRRVWLSTLRGVGYLENDRVVLVNGLPHGITRGIVEDSRRNVWIGNNPLGLFRVAVGSGDVEQIPWARLDHKDLVSAMAADPFREGLWLGFYRGGVAYFADGQVGASYDAADGLGRGTVRTLYPSRDGTLWAATDSGLSRLKNRRIATLASKNGLPCDAVGWVAEDDARSLWLGMPCGLARIARVDIDAWAAAADQHKEDEDVERRVKVTVFDVADGVRIPANPSYYSAPAAWSSDGKLWFISQGGVSVVDPKHIPFNRLPPPVHVEQITADRKSYDPAATDAHVRLPSLVRDLEIDYTALSFVAPEKNRFRIKLEGLDREWQDVGNRRQAFYSNLPPRNYRFRVIASNNSGVWNEAGAALDFSIAPAYYQTTWFRTASVMAVLALLWAAYQLRLRQVAHEFDARLQERVNERTRIARELHDTLLQSFHGLLFRFQAATNKLPDSDVKKQFESAIDQAAQAITEGRDAVQDLRASTAVTNDLAEAIGTLGEELRAAQNADGCSSPTVVDVKVEGTTRDLHPILRDDIYRIAGEALRNAFRHAGARRIEVEIRYDDRELQVRVRDDGKGIDPALLEEERPGHFGIRGMRERAELIGGHLEVWSKAGLGTEVELTIPGAAAYGAPRRRSWMFAARTGATIFAILVCCQAVFALNPALDVSQYAHTSWKIREGFVKGAIRAIAQTSDGYLWLGTEFGLVRFDGVRAKPWHSPPNQALPSNEILALLAARDDTLWIGTSNGLASLRAGKLSQYSEIGGRIAALIEDRDGSIWVSATAVPSGKLCAIREQSVRCSDEDGTFGFGAFRLFLDRRSNLWALTVTGVWRWKPGPAQFFPVPDIPRDFAEDDDGALLVGTTKGIVRLVDGRTELYAIPGTQQLRSQELFRDRDGALWIGTSDRGLVHVHNERTDAFTRSDGLSSDAVYGRLFEDREGNIWVSTLAGLDRFHESAVAIYSRKEGLTDESVFPVLGGRDGTVWLGTNDGLKRWNDGQVTTYVERGSSMTGSNGVARARLPDRVVTSLFEDGRGRIWVATRRGVGYLENDRFVTVDVPKGIVRAIAEDRRSALWFAHLDSGLFRVSGSGPVQRISWNDLGRTDFGNALAPDPVQGGLWIGFLQSGVAYFRDGRIRESYTVNDGLGAGTVNGFHLDRDGTLWAATEGGLSRLKDRRIATLSSRNGLPCDSVHAVLEDDDYAFWLYTSCGIVRIMRSDLDAWSHDATTGSLSTRAVRAMVFDSSDGLRNHGSAGGSPQLAKSSDGKLWFTSLEGVGVVDPRRIPFNTVPPPVHVEQITADRRTYEPAPSVGDQMRLPPLTRDLQIDYTALSFVAPEKMRFRYKLEGFDRDWQDVGSRRQGYYTNLPPGPYRFRVIAANNSGVWNEAGAALDFSIQPAYYQTTWFRTASVAAFLALVWAAYQFRLRQIAQVFDVRLQERVNERTRIARELHDTLLQSFHGLLFRFQAATNMLPDRPVEAKQRFDAAIEQAAQAITEGRDAVQNLRASTVVTNDLAEAIGTLGQELAAAQQHDANTKSPIVDVKVDGTPRDLHPILRDDIYRVAGEALRNAFRHAGARRIEVEIWYDDKQLQVRVRDDGKGIESAVLDEGQPGHFGLRGMRERAELVGGHLDVWSRAGLGTEVELTIPAAAAYATPRAGILSSWFAGQTGTNA